LGTLNRSSEIDGQHIHPGLAWLGESQAGREWLAELPDLLSECAAKWSLRIGEPFPYAFESLTSAATLPDGTSAVLKIQFPGRENEYEASALAQWGGNGAVLLLAHDAERHALLLEHCEPGTPLSDLEQDQALDVMCGLLPRLWKPAGEPFRPLADEAAWWAEYLPESWERAGEPFERGLLDAALEVLNSFPGSQGELVLLSQDLHAGNVLRAKRQPWLLIDPKPLVGEREFSVAAIIRGDELGRGQSHIRHRLDRLTSDLGLDRERARGWTLAQTLAWAVDNDYEDFDQRHVETARWLHAI
jgi:streptomycin 6-kinase